MQKLRLWIGCVCLCGLWGCGPESSEPEQPGLLDWESAGPVMDYGDLLSPVDQALLATDLRTYAQTSGIRLMLYTVPNLTGTSIEGLSLSLKDRLQAGKRGLNNGGIIYLSKEDRQLKVEAEAGLEWQIPDTVALQIIDLMVPDFQADRFLDGLRKGFGRMAELGNQVSWQAAYEGWEAVQAADSAAIGQIVRLEGLGPHREVGSGYTKNQFDPELYGMLGTSAPDSIQVLFSRYMLEMFDNHFGTGRQMTVLGRVQQLEPPVVQLLGIE